MFPGNCLWKLGSVVRQQRFLSELGEVFAASAVKLLTAESAESRQGRREEHS
jgi:hypothetical protein